MFSQRGFYWIKCLKTLVNERFLILQDRRKDYLAGSKFVAASSEGEQINTPHIAQAFIQRQNCNVTINLDWNGHALPMQESIPPDVSNGTLIFIFYLPPSDKYIHMLGIKVHSGAVWVHKLVKDDSQFDNVKLLVFTINLALVSWNLDFRHLILSRKSVYITAGSTCQGGWFDKYKYDKFYLLNQKHILEETISVLVLMVCKW